MIVLLFIVWDWVSCSWWFSFFFCCCCFAAAVCAAFTIQFMAVCWFNNHASQQNRMNSIKERNTRWTDGEWTVLSFQTLSLLWCHHMYRCAMSKTMSAWTRFVMILVNIIAYLIIPLYVCIKKRKREEFMLLLLLLHINIILFVWCNQCRSKCSKQWNRQKNIRIILRKNNGLQEDGETKRCFFPLLYRHWISSIWFFISIWMVP